ncbi:MAG: orotidine-5'-phosphate decarboxylase [Gemmatimonadaceae bacterium]|nr:orotidine-5'-phosphate decarboxylase [Gemmatimonadaceae bacterium]NUQ93905.1 orotidine-5'-phosphate decarboxylase [Gemmatimonadaceae bacterium]NUR19984.1 orotidine-5'-phosphate decarboxylase [Gemmatimonadaceae bacterium]NUS97337.1 orotidine-5'-phosphate decarboxylase [Gemmatimonadaceae bacterium]
MTAIPIVALDVASLAEAMALVARLGDACRFYKVGSELFTREGPAVVRELRASGCEVFLDLKLHDIPNTVRQGAAAAAALDVRLLTVHAGGGEEMVRAAVEGAGAGCGVLAVTVLTSLDAGALGRAWGREVVSVESEVVRLAEIAAAAGAHGVVCSGHELAAVRAVHGERLAPLVPGIRLAGGATHDQARVMGPREAARAGARYIVLGRAVTAAADPVAAMARVRSELDAP